MNTLQPRPISRRGFLRLAASSAAVLAGGGFTGLLSGCTTDASAATVPARRTATPVPSSVDEVHIALRAAPSENPILPGQMTRAWTYQREVLEGDPGAVQQIPGSYLGPILRLRKGPKSPIGLYQRSA